ncbi:MAG TPA: prepilin-type N-terminal cleavage/methylation domain-containing protein [Blastocatellia bacterium]|nr:prepilin-type N-terminal cleavage/methylation domain-containing protein [Blastocatellia bacterium]
MNRTERQGRDRAPRLNSKGADGFSIVEMLIAIVVVAVGLVSIVSVSSWVSRTNTITNNMNVLAAAVQDEADRLRTAVWTVSTEDPSIAVGGSLYDYTEYVPTPSLSAAQPTTLKPYSYTLDPNDPHHASVSGTPLGDMSIRWQVRQGGTPDLRYVTIRAVQVGAPSNTNNAFTVTTVIVRN